MLEEHWKNRNVHVDISHFRLTLSDQDAFLPEDELCIKIYTEFVQSEEIQMLRKDFEIIDHFL